jgi:hypothetical protein
MTYTAEELEIIACVEQRIGRRPGASEIRLALTQAWVLGELDEPPEQPLTWDVMQPRRPIGRRP